MKRRRIINNEGEDDIKKHEIKIFKYEISFPKNLKEDMLNKAKNTKKYIFPYFLTLIERKINSLTLYNQYSKLDKKNQENNDSFEILIEILQYNNLNSIYNKLYLRSINKYNIFKEEFNFYKYTLSSNDLYTFNRKNKSDGEEKSKINLLSILNQIIENENIVIKKLEEISKIPKYNLPYSYGNDELYYYFCVNKIKKNIKNKKIN